MLQLGVRTPTSNIRSAATCSRQRAVDPSRRPDQRGNRCIYRLVRRWPRLHVWREQSPDDVGTFPFEDLSSGPGVQGRVLSVALPNVCQSGPTSLPPRQPALAPVSAPHPGLAILLNSSSGFYFLLSFSVFECFFFYNKYMLLLESGAFKCKYVKKSI